MGRNSEREWIEMGKREEEREELIILDVHGYIHRCKIPALCILV
jgi:hypothetical protein